MEKLRSLRKKLVRFAVVIASVGVLSVGSNAFAQGFGKQKIIGCYLPSQYFPVSAIDAVKAKKLTHINYTFVTVQNGQVRFSLQTV